MKKIHYFLIYFLFTPILSMAQGDLQKLNTGLKTPYLMAEETDRMVSELKKLPVPASDSMNLRQLFETYQLAINHYAKNNHFKQAYFLYCDLLDLKENTLKKEKAALITGTVNQFRNSESELISGIANLKNDIAVFESNQVQLDKKSQSLLRNTSLILVCISLVFIIIFLKISVKLNKLKEEIIQLKKQLLNHEKAALIGRLKDQVIKNNQKQLEITRHEVSALQKLLKQLEPVVGKEKMNEFKKAKESFLQAEIDLKVLVIE